MPRNYHHGRESWIGYAEMLCEARPPHPSRVPANLPPTERALYAMRLTYIEAEHGGAGLGRSAMRAASKHWQEWTAELERRLAARTRAASSAEIEPITLKMYGETT